MKVDLHIHTASSDGTFSIDEVLYEVEKNNIGLFSVCDHDTCGTSYELFKRKSRLNSGFIIGAEISCTHNETEFHLTSYAFDPENSEVDKLMKDQMQLRYQNNDRTIRELEKKSAEVCFSEYESYTHEPKRGGWKPLNFLIDMSIIPDLEGYFKYVKEVYKKPVFSKPETVIDTVKKAGGFPFLAHPSAYNGGRRLSFSELEIWTGFGISGIECYSPYCSRADGDYYADFCRGNKLQISGGSDCHGSFLPRPLGVPEITLDMLKLEFV